MKKWKMIASLIVALMTVATLVACGGSANATANASTDEAKTIVILSPNQYESYIFDSEEDAHSFVEARRIYMDGDIFTQRMVAAVYDDAEFDGRKGKREVADGFVLLHVDNGREWFIEGDAYDFRDQDEDGNADPEWDVEDLSENIQKEILWALTEHPWDVWNWEPYKD